MTNAAVRLTLIFNFRQAIGSHHRPVNFPNAAKKVPAEVRMNGDINTTRAVSMNHGPCLLKSFSVSMM